MARKSRKKLRAKKGALAPVVPKRIWLTKLNIALVFLGLVSSVVCGSFMMRGSEFPKGPVFVQTRVFSDLTYDQLVNLPEDQLSKVDLAQMDLLCATNLPGSENLDVKACLSELDQWTVYCRQQIEKNMYRYYENPSAYHSEWYYRIGMLDTIIKEDFNVHYDDGHSDTEDAKLFFSDSSALFIHGLLSDKRSGTCSSMPILLVSIARRLGYPLYLVSCKNHLLARWDDRRDRFNILSSNDKGMVSEPDSYLKTWPFPISDIMIARNGYLKSMDAKEELASCLLARACCLDVNGRMSELADVCAIGHRLMPTSTAFIKNE